MTRHARNADAAPELACDVKGAAIEPKPAVARTNGGTVTRLGV
jgi:hypothetical protein